MIARTRRPVLVALLAGLSLVLVTLDYRSEGDGVTATLRYGALAAFAPLQQGAAELVRPVRTGLDGLAGLRRVQAENAALRDEVTRLRAGQRGVAVAQAENMQLRAQLSMRQRLGLVTVGARVLAPPPGVLDWSVLLDTGASAGLAPGMPVVTGDGLVGKITEVTPSHARVQLTQSPEAGYAVRLASGGQDGLLTGHGAGPFQLEVLDPNADVPSGTEVVTRAFAGATVPDGLPVGVVGPAVPGSRFLPVRAHADFEQLDLVQVVTNAGRAPTELPGQELVSPPQRRYSPAAPPPARQSGPVRPAPERSRG